MTSGVQVMTKQERMDYYRKRGVKLMNAIEDIKGQCLHEFDSKLETYFWQSYDADSCHDLINAYNKLTRLLTSLEEGPAKGE
jgi:hypothetical protein